MIHPTALIHPDAQIGEGVEIGPYVVIEGAARIGDRCIVQARAIIGEHVELKRTGADFRGPCPFHGGTHRNFAVIPKKGMFYCFVCHEAGDDFTFFMKKLGMDYPTAVRETARRVGITIPERTGPRMVQSEEVAPEPKALK